VVRDALGRGRKVHLDVTLNDGTTKLIGVVEHAGER